MSGYEEELRKKILVPDAKLSEVAKKERLRERADFKESVQWRIFRIMAEFVDGFEFLSDFDKSVTILGSTVASPKNRWYKEVRKLARMLAKAGFMVLTGGGPGIMEAANRGAYEAGGVSAGLNIQLKHVQRANDYVNKAIGFHYFFTRKVMLSYSAQAYVFAPGGFGTLDEFFEVLTLLQTRKIPSYIPIVCLGKNYWQPFSKWIEKTVYQKNKFIEKEHIQLYQMVDSAKEAYEIIKRSKPRDDVNF